MGAPAKPSHLKRKNLILDQCKIDRAKHLLGVTTETEAITRALDAVTEMAQFQAEVEAGFDTLVGAGGFVDALGTASK
ncbi:MAG TPA: hypothetical protein VFE33_23750 [Thermoanaerobaculia bacterium]|nr:hypothetical protein [Thermoanaerobaculia bacterium]